MISFIVGEALKKVYQIYISALLLTATKKTCTNMAEPTNNSNDILNRALKQISKNSVGIQIGLINAALKLLNPKLKWWFVIDDTMLLKSHIKNLMEAILDYCGATGKIDRGMVAIFLCITDGEIIIPIGYKFWLNHKNISIEDYRKKWELGLELLKEAQPYINCKNLLVDGAYANRLSINSLNELSYKFEARFRKDGVIYIDNQKIKVSEFLAPMLKGPRLYSTVRATWQGIELSFTAHKHLNKNGEEIITYTVSNSISSAIQHAKDYKKRWRIEVLFRSLKQSLGIQHCASTNIQMQKAHIDSCLIAYTFLQSQKLKYKYHSVEHALKSLRIAYKEKPMSYFNQLELTFH